MMIARIVLCGAAAVVVSVSASYAGPCASAIDAMQGRIDAKLEAKAAPGRTTKESVAAGRHVQRTPDSIAAAEERLSENSAGTIEVVRQAMARSRIRDNVGDKSGCEQALADVQRAIGP